MAPLCYPFPRRYSLYCIVCHTEILWCEPGGHRQQCLLSPLQPRFWNPEGIVGLSCVSFLSCYLLSLLSSWATHLFHTLTTGECSSTFDSCLFLWRIFRCHPSILHSQWGFETRGVSELLLQPLILGCHLFHACVFAAIITLLPFQVSQHLWLIKYKKET